MASVLLAAYTNYRRDPRVKREAEALVEAGHQVIVLSSRQPGEPNCEIVNGVEVRKVPTLGNKKTSALFYVADYGVFFIWLFFHLSWHAGRYQLIHVNNMPDFLVFAACIPKALGRPVIHDIHDLMPEIYSEKFRLGDGHWMIWLLKIQERWAGKFATAVLTVEERLRDILSERGIPRDKIQVLMNLPDDRIFTPRDAQPPTNTFTIIYHGTLARRLGLDVAIHAVNLARPSVKNLKLKIIGAGEERVHLIKLRDQLELSECVSFSDGFVPVEQIVPFIQSADVGVVPLRISSGTDIMLPTKLLEYVSMGIPCIAPRTGTICRYFDAQMVQFFEAENPDSLAAAIVALYRDPARRASLAREAQRRFASTYTWSIHKKVYTDLVERLVGGRGEA